MRRPVLADLLAALWADRALRSARAHLAAGELHGIGLTAPGPRALGGRRGVKLVLWLRRASCLEGALVRQRFLATRGEPHDIVIGVRSPSESFGAHAWLDGEQDGERMGLHALTRVPLA
jgi:hypothetical protein